MTKRKYSQPAQPAPDAGKWSSYEEWVATLPKCVSYDGKCDGDLEGMVHAKHCPMYGKKPATLRDAYAAGQQSAQGRKK